MSIKLALISGVTGQDGSYLSEYLLDKQYVVYGIVRRSSLINTKRIDHLYGNTNFHTLYGDVTDMGNIMSIMSKILSNHVNYERLEIYNLAAQSHVKVSFEEPIYTSQVDGIGTLNFLEAIRVLKLDNRSRFYQASTSELYGKVLETPQTERTPFYPRSPYGVAKMFSYWMVRNYRESYGIHASNGILFNHESVRRGETFITRKVTIGIGKIMRNEIQYISVGNLDAKRDWGHARDYVRGMWMMLQQETPDDYVLSTGTCYSIRDFIERAFSHVGIEIQWDGTGVNEMGRDKKTGRIYVRVDEKYFRPTEVDILLGDSSKAREVLGWQPQINIDHMINEMVQHDLLCYDQY